MEYFVLRANRYRRLVFALWLFLFSLTIISSALASDASSEEGAVVSEYEQTEYLLGPGDLLKINVFGQDTISGEYRVDGSGMISMPLIGNVQAKGLTLGQLEQNIVKQLQDGFLKIPRVSVEINDFRPFYILGEINKPGSYPYVSNMRVWNAVALAAGFTKRAKKNGIVIIRAAGKGKRKIKVVLDTIVFPGDIIEVPQRLF